MNRRYYTLDTPIPACAERLQTIYENHDIGPFAKELMNIGYVDGGGRVPEYGPILDELETVHSRITLAASGASEYESLQPHLAEHADTLSSLSHHSGISGDLGVTLRSLAADIQIVADGTLISQNAMELLDGVKNTLYDVYTILRTLHSAHQHLIHLGEVEAAPVS